MKLPVNYNDLSFSDRKSVRQEYIRLQNNLCYFCNEPLNKPAATNKRINRRLFPDSFFKHPIHLHHNHETGMTIGVVHCVCNAILWQYYGE